MFGFIDREMVVINLSSVWLPLLYIISSVKEKGLGKLLMIKGYGK